MKKDTHRCPVSYPVIDLPVEAVGLINVSVEKNIAICFIQLSYQS